MHGWCGVLCCVVQARTEAEHMRLEVRRLESSLDRKEVQLMELQVRDIAAGQKQ